jgi:hypothetical protein
LQKFYSFLGKIERLHLLSHVASALNLPKDFCCDNGQDAGCPADKRRYDGFIHRMLLGRSNTTIDHLRRNRVRVLFVNSSVNDDTSPQ